MTGWPAMFALAAVFALGEAVVAWLFDQPRVFRASIELAVLFIVAAWVAAGVPAWRPLLFAAVVAAVVLIAVGLVVIGAAERLELDQVPTEERP